MITDADFQLILSGYKGWQDRKVAKANVLALEHKFFHWFIEFPEVFADGGFDCILGNPPFLGGQKLSGSFGNRFLEYIKYAYHPIGAVDLVTYFFRRIFNILKPDGFQSLISTNTIAQGSAREGGLDVICSNNGIINHAVKSMRWPGLAAVEVSLVTIHKGLWNKDIVLDNKKVDRITPYLDDSEVIGNPFPLKQNSGRSFVGSYVLGMGFILTPEEASELLLKDPRNKDVIFPYLSGDDLNNDPEQKSSRWVINFFDWDEEKAQSYPDCYKILEDRVKPERQRWKVDDNGKEIIGKYALRKPLPQKWWIYSEKRPALYKAISKLDQVMVVSLVSKYFCFEFKSKEYVFMHKLGVIALNDFLYFGLLSSTIHSLWCWKNSSTLGAGTLNYSTTDCYETFPFPKSDFGNSLKQVSEKYYLFRKELLQKAQIGLTKAYNLFHLKNLTIDHIAKVTKQDEAVASQTYSNILTLRELHKQLDEAVSALYGWTDLELEHAFYEMDYLPENNRVRFSISAKSRKEILKRLLLLNQKLHQETSLDIKPKAEKNTHTFPKGDTLFS
jgi:hypothetical protein